MSEEQNRIGQGSKPLTLKRTCKDLESNFKRWIALSFSSYWHRVDYACPLQTDLVQGISKVNIGGSNLRASVIPGLVLPKLLS